MFTGLVEKTARLARMEDKEGYRVLTLELPDASSYAQTLGESIAVNGCCLTVTAIEPSFLRFDVSRESLGKTNLGSLAVGSLVNLERALRLGDRLGGHMVSGHVDATAPILRIEKDAGGWDVYVQLPLELCRYVIPKGSITLDGVSLTVNSLQDEPQGTTIRLTLIPTTIELTSFAHLESGWRLNVEVDLVGKYLERLIPPSSK
jgi:riboflavin synthase